ncbi:uncharacterized protein L3040_009373 [Drepanopeziza brunnea f. sp. 'multigermtubi']|uniref:BNR/Asp-box repeat domain containing protein n=1 Tax=Marssonina brunnea f. sp. multigermtubi (strain MB_m1) TaxID=1072389 RepID=K1WNG5_MARBU|nr:BNR/Asp-box repeat domain containing protein [Drepanopeziza brunnea f. sp. 'multigermtubi' MB_m1]EKD19185.1 BNR/Asp-box repeat domain containing protein [Drepanopeziza brunnea f. sp. 'multigermtubi' MB_m1]KAJ5032781.1 hypothetical protein L3040_009373 [Drepanopeziza brunnea f. sp. 'multigermtubi']
MWAPTGAAGFLALAISISPALSAPVDDEFEIAPTPMNYVNVSSKTIYVPPSDYNSPKTLYGRTIQLHDGTLLATWENYSPEPPLVYFPIYKSRDAGVTWTPFSNVTDQVNGWGLRFQPFLYVLPKDIGTLTEGTILLAGNSVPTDLSATKIDIYASTDDGSSWSFVSSVASGGKAKPTNGETPVWEPFLMVYENQLVIYYSDQSDPAHGQKLCHKVSSDGVEWGSAVNDVAYPEYSRRPGMATIAKLPNGQFILTYENGGGESPSGKPFPVYYRLSSSPLTFNSAPEYILKAGSTYPTSSPTVAWSSAGGPHGTIVVSANSNKEIFLNRNLGAESEWVEFATPQHAAYSREVRVLNDPTMLHIISAGNQGGDNYVTNSVFRLPNTEEDP